MSERISGKVAQITSDRELIINRGSSDGVEVRTYFYVKDSAVEVTDPDSGEILGSVAPIKVVVRAEEVSERFCIARTFRSHEVVVEDAVEAGPMYGLMGRSLTSSQFQPPRPAKFERRVETLRSDPRKGAPIQASESVVSIGDAVESVLPGEDINPVTTTLFR